MSGSHRARQTGALWLFGIALGAALTVPLGLPAALSTGERPTPTTESPRAVTTTTPPRTADSMLKPRGGCPPEFGPSPDIPSVCVSPTPRVVQTPRTTTTRTRVTRTEDL